MSGRQNRVGSCGVHIPEQKHPGVPAPTCYESPELKTALGIRAFQDGATPETVVQRYSTLALPDVYAVIAYYLRHRSEVEGYLARREQKAEEVRQRIQNQQGDLSEIRARLLAQRQP